MGVPSVTKSPAVATEHAYENSLDATATLLFTGRGNFYGYQIEENSGADVFIQFFDAADAGDVTVGTTAPDFTMRIPASGTFGKDVNDSPFHFFALGCVVAVTTTRTGNTNPGAAAVGHFWFWNK